MIKYTNEYSDSITESQAINIGTFTKHFFISDKLKKNEHYTDGNIQYVEYFLEIDEEDIQIRSQYSNIGITFYKEEIIQGNYRKYNVEDQDPDGTISSKRIEVLDQNNDIIYSSVLDVDTNEVETIFKSAYDDNGEYLYEFEYNLDGTLDQVDIMISDDYHPTGTFRPEDIGVDPELQFSWEGFEYYQNAEPIIPN